MESDNENSGLEIDSSPGALVWVRRRNGSWWPGRVLGPEELPENCLNLPGSGTPIKLLGREDGSVDWYNLEKSKRVKSFRCGEYDECIEKAKEHRLHSNRKPVNSGKYVRREDAILHALELEGPFGENQNFCYGNDSSTVKADKSFLQLNTVGHNTDEPVYVAKKSSKHKKSSQKLPESGISFEHPAKQTASNMRVIQKKRWRTPNDSEDDTAKGMKRMRDLQDLGSGMIFNKEPNASVETKGFHDLALPDSASLSESDFDNNLSCDAPINSSRDSCTSLKRKRPYMGQACESLKKKSRHRSLAEVWMGATKVKIPSLNHPGSITEESSRADNSTSKKNDSPPKIDDSADCSGTSCENTGNTVTGSALFQSGMKDCLFSDILEFIEDDLSDHFIDVPVMDGDNAADLHPTYKPFPSTTANSFGEENLSDHCIQVGLVSQLNEGLGEACSSGSSTQVNDVPRKIDMGASEWHTKGKRNARQSSNKTVDLDVEVLVDRTDQLNTCWVNRTAQKETVNSTSDESLTSDSSGQRIKCTSVSEVRDATGDQKPKFSLVNVGRQYFKSENSYVNPAVNANSGCSMPRALGSGALNTGDGLDSPMPTQVPLQPRQIRLPSRYRVSQENSPCLYDVEVSVQSNYPGQRVPLVSLMSKFNGKAIVGHPVTVEILVSGRNPTSNSIEKSSKDKANTVTKSHARGERGAPREKTSNAPMSRSPWSNRKPSSAKKSGFSPRKIRRLSSFAVDHKNKEDRRKLMVEKIGGPAVSCIPLRLVFSRLNEALSSSARQAS